MKHTKVEGRVSQGFTLVEMLVVIAIIAILAALILPALSAAKRRGQIAKAQLEMASLLSAIRDYETDNSVYPVSKAALSAAATASGGAGDFTFGTYNVQCANVAGWNGLGAGFSTPSAAGTIWAQDILTSTGYQTNNAEVIAILMDLEKFGNTNNTVNFGHVRNPKRIKYLSANLATDTKSPGVGLDGVYRDPWGNPYIITMDLNGDDKARDAFYRRRNVSQQQSGSATGYNALANSKDADGNSDYYEANLPVMIWSAGPDKQIDPNGAATQGVNKDNVLSWKQ